jgi:hypothetical protein
VTRGWLVAVALFAWSCDRDLVPSPEARHDAQDVADAKRLEAQLAAIPGVTTASVVVHRPFVDPLAPVQAPIAPSASVVVVGTGDVEPMVQHVAAAVLPDVPMSILVAPPVPPPVKTAKVGPFVVAEDSRRALQATLGIALALIAGLAGYVAWTQRRGIRPHQSSASTTRGS